MLADCLNLSYSAGPSLIVLVFSVDRVLCLGVDLLLCEGEYPSRLGQQPAYLSLYLTGGECE